MLALEFPPISHVLEWPELFLGGTPFAVNKVVLLMWLSAAISFAFIYAVGRDFQMVPTGVQNLGEAFVGFIEDSIVMQTIGSEGLRYTAFLGSMFLFVFVGNIWEVIPGIQMPVNARIAFPMFLALLVWVIFVVLGVVKQGLLGYLKSVAFPPGVPWPLFILVTPIEIVSTFVVRPLSLMVRLFANMLAGHLLLVSFAVITAALWSLSLTLTILPFSFLLLVGIVGFEVLVSLLQAFIFTILTAVYIGSSLHPEH